MLCVTISTYVPVLTGPQKACRNPLIVIRVADAGIIAAGQIIEIIDSRWKVSAVLRLYLPLPDNIQCTPCSYRRKTFQLLTAEFIHSRTEYDSLVRTFSTVTGRNPFPSPLIGEVQHFYDKGHRTTYCGGTLPLSYMVDHDAVPDRVDTF